MLNDHLLSKYLLNVAVGIGNVEVNIAQQLPSDSLVQTERDGKK